MAFLYGCVVGRFPGVVITIDNTGVRMYCMTIHSGLFIFDNLYVLITPEWPELLIVKQQTSAEVCIQLSAKNLTAPSLPSSQDGEAAPSRKGRSSLSPNGELHKVPRLEKEFKKPPPNRNRRRPTKAHLREMAGGQSSGEVLESMIGLNQVGFVCQSLPDMRV